MMTFLTPTSLPVGTSAAGIAVGDYNRDGKADIAVVDQSNANVSLLTSKGDGTFQSNGVYNAGAGAIDAVFGDYNHDGNMDLAVVSTAGSVNVMLGRGPVSAADYVFWRHNKGASVAAGSQGDDDGNGVIDDADYNSLRQHFGQAPTAGAFGAATSNTVGVGSHAISTGDFNGDGQLDIATMNGTTASVLLGNGDGTFQAYRDVAIPGNSTNLLVGDFNHDGYVDLATSNTASNGTITILKGHGDGSFDPAQNVYAFSAPVYVGVGDFNHDGYDDFAVANSYAQSSMSVILNNGDGTYSQPHTYGIPETGYEIQVEDFDGDGNDDFAVRGANEYMVQLGNGDGTFLPTVTYATPSGRFQMGVHGDFNGDGAVDVAYPSTGGVTVMMNANDSVTNLAGAVGFNVATAPTTTAGSVLPTTVTIVGADGSRVPDFQGVAYITSNDAASHTTFSYRFTTADAGVHTFNNIRLVTLGDQTISVSAPQMSTATRTVTVTPAVTRLAVDAPTASIAGGSVNLTVTAYDALGNVGTGYASTIHFSTADVQAGLPADYTFTPADAGVHTFTVTLKTAGQQFVKVSELGRSLDGGAAVTVSPAAVAALSLAGPGGSIGVSRPITVVGRDSFGNIVSSYTGTLHITSSDPNAVLPADVSLTNGSATFNITLLTVGTQTITATDAVNSALTGTMSSDATPPVASQFSTEGYPATVAGVTNNFTVTVRDTIGQIATGYSGTIYFSSSDIQAGLPASYTFTADDAGVHTFSATFNTAGVESITARDAGGAITGTQLGINVSHAAFVGYQVIHPFLPIGAEGETSVLLTAGQVIPLTVRAHDQFGNTVDAYRGTVHITSTDTRANLPGDYTFTASDSGSHVFNVDLRTSTPNGVAWAFNIVDMANATTITTLPGFEITNAAAARFVINLPSGITAGTPFTLKISVLDAYGNRVKNYFGTIHFTNTAGLLGLPTDYTFNSNDVGDHSFTITLATVGDQTLTVADTSDATLSNSVAINVKASSGGGGGGGGGRNA